MITTSGQVRPANRRVDFRVREKSGIVLHRVGDELVQPIAMVVHGCLITRIITYPILVVISVGAFRKALVIEREFDVLEDIQYTFIIVALFTAHEPLMKFWPVEAKIDCCKPESRRWRPLADRNLKRRYPGSIQRITGRQQFFPGGGGRQAHLLEQAFPIIYPIPLNG